MPRRKRQSTPPRPAPPEPERHAAQQIAGERISADADFTGWEWEQVPYSVRKSAKNGAVSKRTVVASECIECKLKMWSRDPAMENLCEVCDFQLRERNRSMMTERVRARGGQYVQPFADNSAMPHIFWPKSSE